MTTENIVVGLMIAMIVLMVAGFVLHSRGGEKSSRRTVEHYHGNWYATWHTPLESKLIAVCAIATLLIGFVIAPIVILADIGT